MNTALLVNGEVRTTRAEGGVPLLFVLRNELGLSDAKNGCGAGDCGACNVLVGGRDMQSCQPPVWSLQGAEVTTLEGLPEHGEGLSEVQQAFRRHGAIQCGYCIPGVMMTLQALRASEPRPSMARVREVLSERHLCRCGTHVRILAAAASFMGLADRA